MTKKITHELGSGALLLRNLQKKYETLSEFRGILVKIDSPEKKGLMQLMIQIIRMTSIGLLFPVMLTSAMALEWGTLYRWKTTEGVRWMLVGEDSIHDHYQGEIQDGLPQGQGRMRYAGGSSYSGEWEAGRYHGLGTNVRVDGSYHIGRFKQGRAHGPGEEHLTNGFRNSGEWKDGKVWNITRFDAEAEIIEKLAQGEVVREIDYGEIRYRKWAKDHWVWLKQGNLEQHGRYQGQVQGLLPHGKGSYLSPLGVKYDGNWEEGLEHGEGSLTHPNGMRSEGEFREGLPWDTVAYDRERKVLFRVKRGRMVKENGK